MNLSRELGWEIPPPAAVSHSASADRTPPIKAAHIPADDADWLSGVGEL